MSSPAVTRAAGVNFANVVRAEWTKLVSVRSVRWTAAATVVLTVGIGILVCAVSGHMYKPEQDIGFDGTSRALTGVALGEIILSAIGVLVISGEYGTGAIRSTLAAVPNRPLLLAGKAALFAAVSLIGGLILTVVSFLAGQAVLGPAPKASFGDPGVTRAVLLAGVGLMFVALMGLGLGAIIRNSAGGIVAAVAILLVLPIVLGAIPGRSVRFTPEVIISGSLATPMPDSDLLSPGIGILMLAIYAAVALLLGGVVLIRRDA